MKLLIGLLLCVALVSAQHDMGGGHDMPTDGTTDELPMCVRMPMHAECELYEMPDEMVHSSIQSLCMMMPFMSGCSIRDYCAAMDGQMPEGDVYCDHFSLLRDLCTDMPGMAGCSQMGYNSMCLTPGSVVQQCDTKHLALPATMATQQLMDSMCQSHYMTTCDEWQSCRENLDCDLLTVYSTMCRGMSSMPECQAWHAMCSEVPEWDYCTEQHDDEPVMRMFFHTGILDYILFESWVPRTDAAFAGSWFVIFVAAILLEALRALRAFVFFRLSAGEARASPDDRSIHSFIGAARPFNVLHELIFASLHLVDVSFALLIMLVAMTFNVWLFLAIIFGALFGYFAFGRFQISSSSKGSACH